MTTDHGIGIDEQIAFIVEEGVTERTHAKLCRGMPIPQRECRERAAMYLTIENTLRTLRPRTAHAQD